MIGKEVLNMKNIFLSRPVMFECSPGYVVAGYMVEQYHEGNKIVEQFIQEEAYEGFCDAIGIIPTMEKEKS